ncbi:MAG: hypothetical protein KDK38_16030 [Leptospiraceae bacterium]|nr:hypothetical protein [Leptospiraceae bacterium]
MTFATKANQVKRRVSGIALILTLVAPILVCFTILKIEQSLIRKEVKQALIEHLDRDQLISFTFNPQEIEDSLDWEHDHEFEYRGLMYDVVERHTVDGNIHLLCWPDKQETELNKELDRLFGFALEKDERNKNQKDRTLHFLKTLFHQKTAHASLITDHKSEEFNLSAFNLCEAITDLSCPPPQNW